MPSEFVRELKRGVAAARQALETAGEEESDSHRARLAELREIARHNGVDLDGPDAGETGR
ncbi:MULTISPECIES: hypothetical protein [Amycolatopsis]|uniref:Uncharacterized protein n=1 Tax=Amycolatopsis dendrobii TaxID=2760662 RepID=A0A7W3VXK5_9PSEU|nr:MULTISPECIES: hypothetical protein [Amycolatopsis]MBB1154985.1 hypothetical protein [Amycolatopsis dendrobii]UKD56206.1 hypothetical protein L3Q65_05670 [Amycolatopsis sp. FU40]